MCACVCVCVCVCVRARVCVCVCMAGRPLVHFYSLKRTHKAIASHSKLVLL